ncbi:bifunctional 2-polyprenyl-6-hydroxyphenol methylase/3-demethylubiquinol 3-O-methyltransferase UbiG [Paraneptunicella aestuarii]|uniref:bifunctional 2-polyprenyl-6-hydroxyphenol methylase/3-demethylubiquinol 3-O-methyltransferase UbiG n=1 Tax=Paraneptunicella aestuarii TaxID=2831148 RepID=UPI001E34B31D|nr:bifunctional 2-polyprenyl-6-hydroxyphenol methylase/3-demethylubiquinol 3-O-methyltransferase UbiG [Paraneptunicella aestuarii]UAA40346.1 bifunctional 2-polyprenyl-6-hydroxyphenol methylase/3-demethylubiquinol 3-O-methyltransferase UbiG [Paraneptunicella aestuarii]
MNVDPQEIEKFEQLASRWWDLEGEFKPLHAINPLRLDFIANHANGLFDKRIVDVGCGGGILAESMARLGGKVTGIDMGEAPLQVARLHSLETGVEVSYEQIPAEDYAEQHTEQADIVTCMEMLEHVPDPESIVRACAKMCKPGGYVFFSTLNRNTKAYLMAILGAEKILRLVPEGTHDYNKFIKPSELLRFADNAGLKARDITGLHMHPISREFYLSDSNVDVNYIAFCEKL